MENEVKDLNVVSPQYRGLYTKRVDEEDNTETFFLDGKSVESHLTENNNKIKEFRDTNIELKGKTESLEEQFATLTQEKDELVIKLGDNDTESEMLEKMKVNHASQVETITTDYTNKIGVLTTKVGELEGAVELKQTQLNKVDILDHFDATIRSMELKFNPNAQGHAHKQVLSDWVKDSQGMRTRQEDGTELLNSSGSGMNMRDYTEDFVSKNEFLFGGSHGGGALGSGSPSSNVVNASDPKAIGNNIDAIVNKTKRVG